MDLAFHSFSLSKLKQISVYNKDTRQDSQTGSWDHWLVTKAIELKTYTIYNVDRVKYTCTMLHDTYCIVLGCVL